MTVMQDYKTNSKSTTTHGIRNTLAAVAGTAAIATGIYVAATTPTPQSPEARRAETRFLHDQKEFQNEAIIARAKAASPEGARPNSNKTQPALKLQP